MPVDFSKGLNLHRAGKRNQRVGDYVARVGEKADCEEQGDFREKNALPPMEKTSFRKEIPNPFACRDAESESDERNQVTHNRRAVPFENSIAEQDDVSRLRIGEYFAAQKVGIRVLQSSGKGKKGDGRKGFRHLRGRLRFRRLRFVHPTILLITEIILVDDLDEINRSIEGKNDCEWILNYRDISQTEKDVLMSNRGCKFQKFHRRDSEIVCAEICKIFLLTEISFQNDRERL